jgi:predicted lipoprotein with Yx(FWY)xxD motif
MNRAAFIGSAAFAVALLVAGCGGYSAAPPAAQDAAAAAEVGIAGSQLGRIVVDGTGRTLYLFEKDENGRSACYGDCAAYWPPLLSQGNPLAHSNVRQSLLGTTRRTDGGNQVTYAGHPLYRFAEDTKPGQTLGEGLQDFGGRWDALAPAGTEIDGDD